MRHGWSLLAALLALASPSLAHAAWPTDPFGYGMPVSSGPADQTDPVAVDDGAGGAFVAWMDARAGNLDVFVQHLDSKGNALWTVNGVAVTTLPATQGLPQLVADGAGGVIVAWIDVRTGVYDLYAQRVNAAGTPVWTADGVPVCTATGNQERQVLASDGAGGVIVAWADGRGADTDIYAQRLSASGVAQWTANGVPVCVATATQTVPVIAPGLSGNVLIAWQDARGASQDIYAQHVSATGVPQWAANGVAVCLAANEQRQPVGVADGAGGLIVAWDDYRSGSNYDIYAQRVDPGSAMQWTPNGVAVCAATGTQSGAQICGDGSGGAIVAWTDLRGSTTDAYAQRVLSSGLPFWTADGVALSTAAGTQTMYSIASDLAGGAIGVWQDSRTGAYNDIYAQRVSHAGSPMWTSNGAPIAAAGGSQSSPVVVSDGAGGAIVCFDDSHALGNSDIHAMRIERNGQLGNPEPVITSVRDVPGDQGGLVKVSWAASYLDTEPNAFVSDYRVWRSVPPNVALARARRAGLTDDPDQAAATGGLWTGPANAQGYAWEAVATQSAAYLAQYSLTAVTFSDSMAGSNPYTVYMVEARAGTSITSDRWYSAPDSGYSVDDLAPPAPSPFAGVYGGGASSLYWGPNAAADLAGFRLYRGTSAVFTPSPANRVTETGGTSFVDAAGQPYWYKLSAVDVHGNESAFATLLPSGSLATEGVALPAALALAVPTPNPARSHASLRYALPREARVRLALYDASGRRVRTLVDATRAAGEHAAAWDLRDDTGHAVGAGLYFARLEAEGRRLVEKVLTLR